MSRILYESDYALLTLDENTKIVHLSWKKPVTIDLYKKVFSEGINSIKGQDVQSLLSDIRNEGAIPIEAVIWLRSDMIPQLKSLGISKVGIIINNELYSQIYMNTLKKAITRQNVSFRFFNEPESAVIWAKA